jgi:hypothetical protein
MQDIVALMTAVAGAPERRIAELAVALERFERLQVPARLRIDGEGLVLARAGIELAVGVARDAGVESAGPQLRTYVRSDYRGTARLAIVDAAADRKHRPRSRGPLVELEAGRRRWSSTEAVLPQPVLDALEHAQPTAVVVAEDQIVTSFAGWVVDPARLGAAVELVRTLASDRGDAPYR